MTTEERQTLEQWLQQPRVKQVFLATPENLERIYSSIKNRHVGKVKIGIGEFEIPPSVREISITNLNAALEGFAEQERWDMVRKSPARIAREEKERNARAIAIEEERQKKDPVTQARIKVERERIEAEAKAVADAADKAYWTERAQKQPGENSLQCLQRYRRERVAAGKELESSFAHSANILTPVLPVGITVHDQKQGTTQIVPLPTSKPGTPDSGNWDVNNAFVTTAKARNRG